MPRDSGAPHRTGRPVPGRTPRGAARRARRRRGWRRRARRAGRRGDRVADDDRRTVEGPGAARVRFVPGEDGHARPGIEERPRDCRADEPRAAENGDSRRGARGADASAVARVLRHDRRLLRVLAADERLDGVVRVERATRRRGSGGESIRLRALRDAPDAFGSSLEREAGIRSPTGASASHRVRRGSRWSTANVGIICGGQHHSSDIPWVYATWVEPSARGKRRCRVAPRRRRRVGARARARPSASTSPIARRARGASTSGTASSVNGTPPDAEGPLDHALRDVPRPLGPASAAAGTTSEALECRSTEVR